MKSKLVIEYGYMIHFIRNFHAKNSKDWLQQYVQKLYRLKTVTGTPPTGGSFLIGPQPIVMPD